jgi:hypothetical protein
VLDTGIQRQIRLVVTKGLVQPWSMAFLPDGRHPRHGAAGTVTPCP